MHRYHPYAFISSYHIQSKTTQKLINHNLCMIVHTILFKSTHGTVVEPMFHYAVVVKHTWINNNNLNITQVTQSGIYYFLYIYLSVVVLLKTPFSSLPTCTNISFGVSRIGLALGLRWETQVTFCISHYAKVM